MKIYTVTSHFYGSVKTFFRKCSVEVLPKDYKGVIADLIVFTGGEDVHPSRYGGTISGTWYDESRDELELKVLTDIRKGKLRTTKVLGICRGMQLLNVGFGGTLIGDIPTKFGKGHDYSHPIKWTGKNMFSNIFTTVNSMHHQGLEYVGESFSRTILGIEPDTGIIEAILWGDKFLGVQFHPELWRDSEERDKISDVICEWVIEKISAEKTNVKKYSGFSAYFTDNGTNINVSPTITEGDF